MAFEANLGVLTVKKHQEVIQTNHLGDQQIVFKEANKTEDLQAKFLESRAGKKIKEALEVIKEETTAEKKKEKLVLLMKYFFALEAGDDESLLRFVDSEGTQWVRINSGSEIFDISLEWTDLRWLINWIISWYLERAASVVNGDEADTEKQISLKYEQDKLVIEEIEQDVANLQAEVVWWLPVVWNDSITWDQVEAIHKKNWFFSGETIKAYWLYAVNRLWWIIWLTTTAGKLSKNMIAKKDPTKAAASEKKWYDFGNTLTWFKNTLASAFGIWPKSPPASPGVSWTWLG